MAGHTTFSLNPARIAVLYAVMGVLWIVLSDSTVEWVLGTGPFAAAVQTYKGVGYVLVTSILLFWLIRLADKTSRSKDVRFRELFDRSQCGVYYAHFRTPVPTRLPPQERFAMMLRELAFTDCNDALAKMCGRQSGAALLREMGYVMEHEVDTGILAKAVLETFEKEKTGGMAEMLMVNKLGQRVKYLESFQFGFDETREHLTHVWGTTIDLSDRVRFEQTLESLVTSTASHTGKDYFATVVEQMALLLGVRIVKIGELCNDNRSIRTIATWRNGELLEPAVYDLQGTPCEQVVSGKPCFYPQGVADAFPNNPSFCDEGIESFLGVPLLDHEQQPMGVLLVLDDKPTSTETAQTVMSILKIIAARVSSEMLRERAEADLLNTFDEVQALKNQLQADNLYLQQEIAHSFHDDEIIGESEPIRRVMRRVEQVAGSDTTVLILGETGTGKELIARAIHKRSSRSGRPMIRVNCAALPDTLIESELFGHEKGAFTGADQQRKGRFELADGGTIMLDEVGELPLALQAKLLRAMQEGEFERLGGSETLTVDVHIIAATNRDLSQAITEGTFREDLYYRLNVLPIEVPPLRERIEDLPLLISAFTRELAGRLGKQFDEIPRHRIEQLTRYPWPGNVRELRNMVERATILSTPPTLDLEVPTPEDRAASTERQTLDDVQKQHINRVLEMTGGKISGPNGAAQMLGLKPTTLRSRMGKLGIE